MSHVDSFIRTTESGLYATTRRDGTIDCSTGRTRQVWGDVCIRLAKGLMNPAPMGDTLEKRRGYAAARFNLMVDYLNESIGWFSD